MAKLKNTGPLITTSLNYKSCYCYLSRSAKDSDQFVCASTELYIVAPQASQIMVFLQRRGLGPLLCYVMGLNESNHFSGLTSAFRAAHEKSNLKVGLFSAFDQYTSLKLG